MYLLALDWRYSEQVTTNMLAILLLRALLRYHRLLTSSIYFHGSYLLSKVKTYGKIRSLLYYVPESDHAYVTQTKSTAWLNDTIGNDLLRFSHLFHCHLH